MTPGLNLDSFSTDAAFIALNARKRLREPEPLLLNFFPPLPQLYIPSPAILGPAEEIALSHQVPPPPSAPGQPLFPAALPAPAPAPDAPSSNIADLFFSCASSGTESSVTDDDFAAIDYVVESTQQIESHPLHESYAIPEPARKRTKRTFQEANVEVRSTTETFAEHNCGTCRLKFKTRSELSRHVRTAHQGKRMFPCDKCPKTFAHSGHLNRHRSTVHDRIRRHKCGTCGDSFFQASHLKSHVRHVHQGHKPWACDLCDVRLATESGLRNHLRNEHADEVYECPEQGCNESFGLATDLSRHCHRVHGLRD